MKGRDMGLRFAIREGGWVKLTICIFRSSRTIDDGELFYEPELNLSPAGRGSRGSNVG